MSNPLFDPSKRCRYLKKPCIKHDCTHYVPLQGTNPQTGAPMNEFACIDHWQLLCTIEGNNETRRAGAAVESMRNELVQRLDNPTPQVLKVKDNRAAPFRLVDEVPDKEAG